MNIKFTKMHGAGNDYIYINCFETEINAPEELAIKMSPRHYSVGADGVVLICPSKIADAKMRMFNADGSEGEMCGNAIRCVGKFLYDNGICKSTSLDIETLAGIKKLSLTLSDGLVSSVSVDMGKASIKTADIPALFSTESVIDSPLNVCGKEYRINCVSMGNPHAVIFCTDVKNLKLEDIGPHFESNSVFPKRINTEFVKTIDSKTLEMRVWERGSGETFACGTGACATVVAACINGHCKYDEEITVKLLGGDLYITADKQLNVTMRGSATKVYEGEMSI